MLSQFSGKELALLATFIAIQMSSCMSEDEIALLAAFYSSLSEQLELIALVDFEKTDK